jgi:hypothetical protein
MHSGRPYDRKFATSNNYFIFSTGIPSSGKQWVKKTLSIVNNTLYLFVLMPSIHLSATCGFLFEGNFTPTYSQSVPFLLILSVVFYISGVIGCQVC